MKIADNRALVAKKRIYNQPEVTVASIALQSNLLAGSNMNISNTETSAVW